MDSTNSLAVPRLRNASRNGMPATPEPASDSEARAPSPPRPRFRIKRRNASNLAAPTEQFLASVAAADLPIPSIEEPQLLVDEEMSDSFHHLSQYNGANNDFPTTPIRLDNRYFSPPKTPAPGFVPSLSPKQYPNWSIDSTASSLDSNPGYESSRPSTAHSTHTSASIFSYFSMSSEEMSRCASPKPDDIEVEEFSKDNEVNDTTIRAPAAVSSRRKKRKFFWPKMMSQHLWATYLMYLQDPKVTPFRIGRSGIPPSGVCTRVAQEAKRSWKATKQNGNLAPVGHASETFVQWSPTCSATRAHLLELCKANARTSSRNDQYLAHSPTPFGRTVTRFWNRRSAPMARSPSVFSGQDMAMSLAVSTSESMQLHGPLAQLTSSHCETNAEPAVAELPPPLAQANDTGSVGLEPLESEPTQLASPFVVRSYGPSSSNSLPSSFVTETEYPARQVQTTGPYHALKSPVKLSRSRSTQKRRTRQGLPEPRKMKRASLGSDFWIDPSTDSDQATVPSAPKHKKSFSVSMDERPGVFGPRANLQELFEASRQLPSDRDRLAAPEVAARLGSPFSLTNSSFSVPNRLSSASNIDAGTVRRPFATVQRSSENTTNRSSLATRIAYIDERLKYFRRRGLPRRRSESPL